MFCATPTIDWNLPARGDGVLPCFAGEKRRSLSSDSCFFVDKIRPRFESENFTFYVYVTDERVKLVDFNPWAEFALPLLFAWEELEQGFEEEKEVKVEFRIVESRCKVLPGLKTAVPYDYLDTSPGSGWDQFFRNAGEELRHQNMSSDAGA